MCTDVYVPGLDFAWPKEYKPLHGEVPKEVAEEAKRYIRQATTVYPFQMRHYFGDTMWMRFCETWTLTGDARRAMRAI